MPSFLGIHRTILYAAVNNNWSGPFLGQAYGETFPAADTLIESITAWRSAWEDTSYAGWHLYISAVNSFGYPDPTLFYFDGPTIYNYYGDGIHPTPMAFVFDPPLALPSPGRYEFAIQLQPCSALSNMLMSDKNPYAEGEFWLHGRTYYGGCFLRAGPAEYPDLDIIFTIRFCQSAVPTMPSTWGRVRSVYR